MKKVFAIILSMLVLGLALTACGKKEEAPVETLANDTAIVGTWMEDYWDSGYTFNADGTGKDIFWSQDFTYTALDGNLTISYVEGLWAEKDFTYTVAGNVLTLTEVTEPSADGQPAEEPGTWDYTKTE
ncbi:MAG: hypothetical protein IKG00_01635 [Lachnospiraceae bacterium]|nr:hypothetical protein [Lachnospiraceae bacterium]